MKKYFIIKLLVYYLGKVRSFKEEQNVQSSEGDGAKTKIRF